LTAACAANAISGADSTWDCVGEIWASWIVPPLLAPLFAVLLPGALLALLLQAATPVTAARAAHTASTRFFM
jgi:phosphate/sulfate permease